MVCNEHGLDNVGSWTSSKGRIFTYCRICRRVRAKKYTLRLKEAQGHHTNKEWMKKLSEYTCCPNCKVPWKDIPLRPDKRYKNAWTKDHIIPLNQGGTNNIANIQPLCYHCNFGKGDR